MLCLLCAYRRGLAIVVRRSLLRKKNSLGKNCWVSAVRNPDFDPLGVEMIEINYYCCQAIRKGSIASTKKTLFSLFHIIPEPSAVAFVTNTMHLVATLVHLAHNPPESSSNVSLVAYEALATISVSLVVCEGSLGYNQLLVAVTGEQGPCSRGYY